MPHSHLIWDSTNPFNVPPDVDCIAYFGGRFHWSAAAIARAHAVYRLTEIDGHPEWMRDCRGVAVENGACSVDTAIRSCIARHDFGHDDFTCYTSLDPGDDTTHQPGMAGIIGAFRTHAPGRPFRIHVADANGDPSPVTIDGVTDWAKQFEINVHNAYDLSALHGVNDLVTH